MEIKKYKNNFINWFNQLSERKRALIIVLVVILGVNLFYRQVIGRTDKLRRNLKTKLSVVDSELRKVKGYLPDLDKEKIKLESQMQHLKRLNQELEELEKIFPSQGRVPYLLEELIKRGKSGIDFVSLIPVPQKEKTLYNYLEIEMIIRANFSNLVNYISSLEAYPALMITDVILQKTDVKGDILEAKLNLYTLLTDRPTDSLSSYKMKQEVFSLKRDPFSMYLKVSEEPQKDLGLRLTGIIFRQNKSSCIINAEIYKIGDKVGEKKIIQILKDSVVLSDDKEIIKLKLED